MPTTKNQKDTQVNLLSLKAISTDSLKDPATAIAFALKWIPEQDLRDFFETWQTGQDLKPILNNLIEDHGLDSVDQQGN